MFISIDCSQQGKYEGFGSLTKGGEGKPVYHVTSLKDDGSTGTLRDALSQGNRCIVFDTAGTIWLSEDLEIKPTKMDWTFYCEKCNSMGSFKTCPHPNEDHKMISGTKLREMLSNGEYPPDYITRPEVSDILIDYYKSLEDKE